MTTYRLEDMWVEQLDSLIRTEDVQDDLICIDCGEDSNNCTCPSSAS